MHQITMENRAVRFLDYVDSIRAGELVSRSMMAERMGCSYFTAMYNLEKAVSERALKKVVGYIGLQAGWLYCLPQTQPGLFDG